MGRKKPEEPIRPDRPQGMIQVMVTLARPDPEELAGYNRAQKFQLLQDNTAKRREHLIAWLKEQDLTDQVAEVGEPTAFNVLFVTTTQAVAERLADAPGVLDVSPTGEFQIDLPKPSKKGPTSEFDESEESG